MASNVKSAPGVGVAVVVWQSDTRTHLLLGLGHSEENRDQIYAMTGGHWESGESLEEAAQREVYEEAGLQIRDLSFISVQDFFNPEKMKSYVTLGFEAISVGGDPKVMEPTKKVNWKWVTPSEALTRPLFLPDRTLIERTQSGVVYEGTRSTLRQRFRVQS
ncbi:MAG: nucleotide triphosphate diphosphatase NUDT15 [Gammaproteobacteria bacterium]